MVAPYYRLDIRLYIDGRQERAGLKTGLHTGKKADAEKKPQGEQKASTRATDGEKLDKISY